MLKVLDALNESQARWYVAREVLARGRGGLKAMYELTGMSRPTILKGIRELRGQKGLPRERVRQPGGGRRAQATGRVRSGGADGAGADYGTEDRPRPAELVA